jgi:hypothetical protein
MTWEPMLNEWVWHKDFKMRGRIVTVDKYYGWFEVNWRDGRYCKYTTDTIMTEPLTDQDIKVADQRLREENMGITDSWREYDEEVL